MTLGTIQLSVPGKHNVYNALATVITCLEAGFVFRQIAQSIAISAGRNAAFKCLAK